MEFTTAIIKVLTSARKKDAKEEIKLIESKGYEVYKNGLKGVEGFCIRSPKTNKSFYLTSRYSYQEHSYIYDLTYHTIRYSKSAKFYSLEELKEKFNFEGYLNKEFNMEYNSIVSKKNYWGEPKSEAYTKYESLNWKKRDVNYHQKEIEKAKAELEKQIARLQHDILYHTERLAESKSTLAEYRKEIGLAK